MSDDKTADKISRQKDGPFDDPKERQELRYVAGDVLFNKVDKDAFDSTLAKIEALWWALGWIPVTLKNWKIMMIAIGISVFVGGQTLIDNVAKFLGGFLP
jgi:hypothetical protein